MLLNICLKQPSKCVFRFSRNHIGCILSKSMRHLQWSVMENLQNEIKPYTGTMISHSQCLCTLIKTNKAITTQSGKNLGLVPYLMIYYQREQQLPEYM